MLLFACESIWRWTFPSAWECIEMQLFKEGAAIQQEQSRREQALKLVLEFPIGVGIVPIGVETAPIGVGTARIGVAIGIDTSHRR